MALTISKIEKIDSIPARIASRSDKYRLLRTALSDMVAESQVFKFAAEITLDRSSDVPASRQKNRLYGAISGWAYAYRQETGQPLFVSVYTENLDGDPYSIRLYGETKLRNGKE